MKRVRRPKPGESWQAAAGVPFFHGHEWRAFLEHVRTRCAAFLRAHGLDPDVTGFRGDQQERAKPYLVPVIREAYQAYRLAVDALRDPPAALTGYRLANLWGGEAIASIAAPLMLKEQRSDILRMRGRRSANAQRRTTAEAAALKRFVEWRARMKAALRDSSGAPLDTAEVVRKYLATQRQLSDRERRRIRALRDAGRILPLK